MGDYVYLLVSAIFRENILLIQYLGNCPSWEPPRRWKPLLAWPWA